LIRYRFTSAYAAPVSGCVAQKILSLRIREVKWGRLETGPVHLTNIAWIVPRVPIGERKASTY